MRYLRLFENFEAPLQKIEDWAKSKGVRFDITSSSITLHNIYSKWKYFNMRGKWYMNWSIEYSHLDGEQRAKWKEKTSSVDEFITTFTEINRAEKIFRVVLFFLKIFEVDLSKQKKEFIWRVDETKGLNTMVAWSYPKTEYHDSALFTIEYANGKFLMNDYAVGNMRNTPVDEKTGELIEKILACTFFHDKTVHEVVNVLKKRPLKRCLEIIGNPPDWKIAASQLRGSITSDKFNF